MRKPAAKPVGRPYKRGELNDVQHPVKMPESLMEQLRVQRDQTGVPIGRQIRDAIENALSGRYVDIAMVGTDNVTLKLLTKAPAGPWEEAIEHAGTYTLGKDVAAELDVNPGSDVVVRVLGESMDSSGIFDGSLLVMRPLNERQVPRRGDVALVQVVTADGDYQSTIKHWAPGEPPKLTDGDGSSFDYPDGVTEVKAVAVAKGIIGRL